MAGQCKADLSLVLENKQPMVCFICETEFKNSSIVTYNFFPPTFDSALGRLLPLASESTCLLLGRVVRPSLPCFSGCVS